MLRDEIGSWNRTHYVEGVNLEGFMFASQLCVRNDYIHVGKFKKMHFLFVMPVSV